GDSVVVEGEISCGTGHGRDVGDVAVHEGFDRQGDDRAAAIGQVADVARHQVADLRAGALRSDGGDVLGVGRQRVGGHDVGGASRAAVGDGDGVGQVAREDDR